MNAALVIVAVLIFLVVLFLFSAIKVAREYERGIVFRLGRLLPEPKGRLVASAWLKPCCVTMQCTRRVSRSITRSASAKYFGSSA